MPRWDAPKVQSNPFRVGDQVVAFVAHLGNRKGEVVEVWKHLVCVRFDNVGTLWYPADSVRAV